MPSFTVIAPRWNPIQRWRVHGLGDEFWTDRASSGLDKVPGRSQVSAEQNEPRTSWKDEEVVENEAVSHKRCHAKNKQTRVRQPTPPAKPARHHVNSINQHPTDAWAVDIWKWYQEYVISSFSPSARMLKMLRERKHFPNIESVWEAATILARRAARHTTTPDSSTSTFNEVLHGRNNTACSMTPPMSVLCELHLFCHLCSAHHPSSFSSFNSGYVAIFRCRLLNSLKLSVVSFPVLILVIVLCVLIGMDCIFLYALDIWNEKHGSLRAPGGPYRGQKALKGDQGSRTSGLGRPRER
ncbi:hypothetical protein C8R44DRAFT_744514 [Mycena epipterygia]|nr:hypothetical protein C8R44DRAFT_744514 [Mycena epipterygia]